MTMKPRTRCAPAGALPLLSVFLLAAGAQAGPVLLIGDAADDHAGQNVYANLVDEVLSNVTNGQTGILALGVAPGSEAADWLLGVSALLTPPQPITFVTGETISAIGFSGYGLIYVPSSAGLVDGGITQAENDFLELRASDLASFLDGGGGLVALSQGELSNAWAFLGDFAEVGALAAPGGFCGGKELFDDVSPSEAGALFGVTATNLDGCCWGNVFTSFAETLTPLAAANEPGCPDFQGEAAILVGDVEIPDINFDPPTVTPAAGEPDIQAVGNLDNDPAGTTDVIAVIPNQDPKLNGVIQPFENLGTDNDGFWLGLDPKATIEVGVNPAAVAVGLFNGDELLDLAVPNFNDDTVSILFNDGGFAFTEVAAVPVGSQPSSIAAADFTEDGAVDLAVGLFGDQSVVILENDGNGNFTPLAGSEGPGFLGLGPGTLFSDDFDNNKCPDLTGSGDEGGGIAGTGGLVFVAFGLGGGAFSEPVFFEVGNNPEDIAVSDFDNNGFQDIATSNAADNTVSVLLNTGGAAAGATSFEPQLVVNVGTNPVSVEAADLNADGDPDLAVVAEDLSIGPAVQVLANRLDGGPVLSFGNPVGFSVDADPNFVVASDMNTDGLPDLVTVNQEKNEGEGSVSVLLLQPPATGLDCPGDLNGDGVVNVIDLLELLFSWGVCPPEGECPADLNGDGVIDVLDLLELLMLWGPCPSGDECPWDLNGDGVVDGLDIAELLANLGDCKDPDNCPWDLDGDGTVGLLDLWVLILHLGDCEE